MGGGRVLLPTRPKQYCDIASLVYLKKKFSFEIIFAQKSFFFNFSYSKFEGGNLIQSLKAWPNWLFFGSMDDFETQNE